MRSDYRFIAIDVDGTLMNSRNELPEANVHATATTLTAIASNTNKLVKIKAVTDSRQNMRRRRCCSFHKMVLNLSIG